jgi:hypothetical protein
LEFVPNLESKNSNIYVIPYLNENSLLIRVTPPKHTDKVKNFTISNKNDPKIVNLKFFEALEYI